MPKFVATDIRKVWAALLLASSVTIMVLSGINKPELNIQGLTTPILIFEFADSTEELTIFFESAGSSYINQLDVVNWFDYVFMVVYAAFLAVWGSFLAKNISAKYKAVWLLAALALFFDFAENQILFRFTEAYLNGTVLNNSDIVYLQWFTWIKWFSIALALASFSFYFAKQKGIKKAVSFVFISPIILGIIGFVYKSVVIEFFSLSISVSFVILMFFSFVPVRKNTSTFDSHQLI